MGWVEGGKGLVFRMMISSVKKLVKTNEITVWDAALSTECVENFAERRSRLLHVDII